MAKSIDEIIAGIKGSLHGMKAASKWGGLIRLEVVQELLADVNQLEEQIRQDMPGKAVKE